MSEWLREGLQPRLDTMLLLAVEQHEALMDLPTVATQLGIGEETLRQRVQRGEHLAIQRGDTLYSHARLAL